MKKINKKNKLIGAALIIAAIAFAGTASTAVLTVPAGVGSTLGYDTTTVTGGTVVSMHYNLVSTATPDTISTVTVRVADPTGGSTPLLGIRLDTSVTSNTVQTDCGTPTQVGAPGTDWIFICGKTTAPESGTALDTAANAVNALTLATNYLTIQNV